MLRVGKDVLQRTVFDDAPFVHDGNFVGDFSNDAEVVRNEDERHLVRALQLPQELQNRCLNGHVESRGRLIGNEEIGLAADCHGDHDTLFLPTGELVGIAVEDQLRVREPNLLEELNCPLPCLLPAHTAVEHERFHDLLSAAEDRVQRGHGFLEDHGDVVSPILLHLPFRELQQVYNGPIGMVEENLPAEDSPRRSWHQAQYGESRDRFPRAGFSNNAQRSPPFEPKTHLIDCPDGCELGAEFRCQPAHL